MRGLEMIAGENLYDYLMRSGKKLGDCTISEVQQEAEWYDKHIAGCGRARVKKTKKPH